MIMNSLQSFNIGTVGQIVKLVKEGLPGSNLTPAEKWNARKATAQLFAVQGALAGAMGMPFAASAVALLDNAFPGLEVQKNIRALTQKLFQEDDDHDTPLIGFGDEWDTEHVRVGFSEPVVDGKYGARGERN